MIHDIFMPALSSTMTEGKIVSWEKAPGDKIEKGETVVVVESDKADMDVESFYSGYLATILVPAGEEAPVGQAIAYIAETEAEIEEAKQKASQGQQATPAPQNEVKAEPDPIVTATVNTTAKTNGRIVVSPRAKKLAKEFKVDLSNIVGTGLNGRIIAEDVEKLAGKVPQTPKVSPVIATVTATPSIAPAPIPVNNLAGQTIPFNTLQQAVIRNMMASLQVPTFQVSYSINTDQLDSLYRKIKSKGVTMTALLAKAVAVTLQKHPVVNASFSEAGIKYNESINIAVAVAMPDGGLITPVIKNADQIDIYSLARNWQDLVNRARAKQLQPDEYTTGTFTLSNLGMFGVSNFTAILPPGLGSILAIGGASPTVVANGDGLFGVKNQMSVNITCDHRIIYGADAAAFLQDLAKLIETDVQSLTL
ncbi:dihydrolipoamide acetyltransferase component of pyruvate dehydrogenase complex [Geminocystis sp. NIES-3708]|uniref:dihydrolipoamide acetyltransferase family protein n=1 Tax=Geminocystis sp. NIES-3708 TaxID=1615909 RepID=UPI0005FCB649|nr:dihydrolipoamide acetyltransferase family protein [Geminocystis sp. NIES-3708]BAQ60488.1 dihydrolipoamide acetyltransferase component of pyruvate dehydrogenase complex [Geminocystis sp. NIES-3708]